jgi:hypothetical protein
MNVLFFITAPNTKLFILKICRSLESAAQSTLRFTLPEAIFIRPSLDGSYYVMVLSVQRPSEFVRAITNS